MFDLIIFMGCAAITFSTVFLYFLNFGFIYKVLSIAAKLGAFYLAKEYCTTTQDLTGIIGIIFISNMVEFAIHIKVEDAVAKAVAKVKAEYNIIDEEAEEAHAPA